MDLSKKKHKSDIALILFGSFAHREVPQEFISFVPFELLYGCKVRGPLDVLKEVWTGEEVENVSVAACACHPYERPSQSSIQIN